MSEKGIDHGFNSSSFRESLATITAMLGKTEVSSSTFERIKDVVGILEARFLSEDAIKREEAERDVKQLSGYVQRQLERTSTSLSRSRPATNEELAQYRQEDRELNSFIRSIKDSKS